MTPSISRYLLLSLGLFALLSCERAPKGADAPQERPLVKELHFGTYHLCALDDQNRAWCSGDNEEGQLGDGTTFSRTVLTPVANLNTLAGITVSLFQNSCAWDDEGTVYCWGSNAQGILGPKELPRSAAPKKIEGLPPVEHVVLGAFHACALTRDGEVYCWGDNRAGQAAQDEQTPRVENPALVEGLSNIRDLVAGAEHTCAATKGGSLFCWGKNDQGQLGLGTDQIPASSTPRAVGLVPSKLHAISASFNHTCATFGERRRLYCWGANNYGQLGLDDLNPRFYPEELPEIAYVDELVTAAAQVCARIGDDVFCAGEPLMAPEELAQQTSGFFFQKNAALEHTTQMWGGALAICGTITDGTLACRGIDPASLIVEP